MHPLPRGLTICFKPSCHRCDTTYLGWNRGFSTPVPHGPLAYWLLRLAISLPT